MRTINTEELHRILKACWSSESSPLWTEQKPSLGQCGVTALVVQDVLGGEILKTRVGDSWHFYNLIDGRPIDFTAEQFDDPIVYLNQPSNRNEAFADTNDQQYSYLKTAVFKAIEHT